MSQFDGFSEDIMRKRRLLKWDLEDVSGHWVAEMDFGTAPVVEEALIKAIRDGFLGYMPAWLKERTQVATANLLDQRFGWKVDPAEVSLASSVLDGLRVVLQHFLSPGSRVLVPTPAYMPFLTMPKTYGHEVVQVPSYKDDTGTWRLDFQQLRKEAAGAELLILCNPWNPTGRVLCEAELNEVGSIALDHDLIVFNDEIHALVVPEHAEHIPYVSLNPAFADHTVTAIAASKGFNVAGLHCAQMVVTGDMTERFKDVVPWLGAPTPLGALAASVAYEQGQDWLAQMNEYIRGNIALVDDMLNEANAIAPNLTWTKPEGTYLGWMDTSALQVDNPAAWLRTHAQVAVNEGATLGRGYDHFIRFNMASSRKVVQRSVQNILNASTPAS